MAAVAAPDWEAELSHIPDAQAKTPLAEDDWEKLLSHIPDAGARQVSSAPQPTAPAQRQTGGAQPAALSPEQRQKQRKLEEGFADVLAEYPEPQAPPPPAWTPKEDPEKTAAFLNRDLRFWPTERRPAGETRWQREMAAKYPAPPELQAARSVIDNYRSQTEPLPSDRSSSVPDAQRVIQKHAAQYFDDQDADRLRWADSQPEVKTEQAMLSTADEWTSGRSKRQGRYGERRPQDYAEYAAEVAKRAGLPAPTPEFIVAVKPTLDAFDLSYEENMGAKTPEDLRGGVLEALRYSTQAQDRQKTLGWTARTAGLGIRGLVRAGHAVDYLNPLKDAEQWKFEQAAIDIVMAPERLVHPDQGFWSRNAQAALAAMPQMAGATAAGGVGGVALMFGLPTAVETTEYAKEHGASKAAALAGGVTAGTLETLLFSRLPATIIGRLGGPVAGEAAVKSAVDAARRYGVSSARGAGLMTTADLQHRLIQELAIRSGGQIDQEFMDILEQTVRSLPDVTVQSAMLHLPGGASEALRAKPQLDGKAWESIKDRVGKGGTVSRTEALALGVPPEQAAKAADRTEFVKQNQDTIERAIIQQPQAQGAEDALSKQEAATANVGGGPRVEEARRQGAEQIGGEGVRQGGPEGGPIEEGKAEVAPPPIGESAKWIAPPPATEAPPEPTPAPRPALPNRPSASQRAATFWEHGTGNARRKWLGEDIEHIARLNWDDLTSEQQAHVIRKVIGPSGVTEQPAPIPAAEAPTEPVSARPAAIVSEPELRTSAEPAAPGEAVAQPEATPPTAPTLEQEYDALMVLEQRFRALIASGKSPSEALEMVTAQGRQETQPQPEAKPAEAKAEVGPVPVEPAPTPPVEHDLQTVLRAVKEQRGTDLTPRAPQGPVEGDIADFLTSRKKRFSFVDSDDPTFTGLRSGSLILLRGSRSGNDLWQTVGHEVAHESGLDKILPTDDATLAAAREVRLEWSSGSYRQRLESDPELLDREARADLVGQFLRDPAFRENLRRTRPTVWQRIKDFVLKVIGKWTPQDEAHKLVLDSLRASESTQPSKGALAAPPAPAPTPVEVSPEILKIAKTVEDSLRRSGQEGAADWVNFVTDQLARKGKFDPSKGLGDGYFHNTIKFAAQTAYRDKGRIGDIPEGKRERGVVIETVAAKQAEEPTDAELVIGEDLKHFDAAFGNLTEGERDLLRKFYGLRDPDTGKRVPKKTLREIAVEDTATKPIGAKQTSEQMVSRRKKKALDALEAALNEQQEQEAAATKPTATKPTIAPHDVAQRPFFFETVNAAEKGLTFTIDSEPGVTFGIEGDRLFALQDGKKTDRGDWHDFGNTFSGIVGEGPKVEFTFPPAAEPTPKKAEGVKPPPPPPAAQQGPPSPVAGRVGKVTGRKEPAAAAPPAPPAPVPVSPTTPQPGVKSTVDVWANFLSNHGLDPKKVGDPLRLVQLAEALAQKGRPSFRPHKDRLESRRLLVNTAMDLGIDLAGMKDRGKLIMDRGLLDIWNQEYAKRFGSEYGTAGWREAKRRTARTTVADRRRAESAAEKTEAEPELPTAPEPEPPAPEPKPAPAAEQAAETPQPPPLRRPPPQPPPRPAVGGPSAPIPVSPTPAGRTPSTGQVVEQLSQQFGVPIRKGHFGGPHAGIYKTLEEVARLKGYGDIAAASHEVAHHLDKVGGVLNNWQQVPAAARAELRALDYQPNRGDIHEGFAEYMRHRLTRDDAATVAPQFDAWFNNTWLSGRKGTADAIARAKATVSQWRDAGSLGRVEAQIDMGEGRLAKVLQGVRHPIKTIRTVADWITDNWINRLAPLLRVSKEMTGAKTSSQVMQKMGADYNFWAFAKVSNMAAAAKARAWAETGVADVAGNKVGAGLRETLAPIAGELRDQSTLLQFYAYCYARHAVDLYDLHAQAMQNWIAGNQSGPKPRLKEPGILEQDARNVVAQFDTRPGWQAASDGITNWHNALIDYLVDAGRLPQECADIMRAMYPHYIALARKMDSEFAQGPGGGGTRYANLPSGVKRLKGSGREIQPPLESALAYAEQIIGIADKVRVGRMLVDAAEKYDMLGDMVEKVGPKTVQHSTRLKSLKSQLEAAGADLSTADMDALLTVFSQEVVGDPKENIITLYRGGEQQAYWVRDDLYRALTAYDKPLRLPTIIEQTFGRVARAIRLGATGARAGFSLLTNPLRDVQTAMMQTEYQPRNPFSLVANAVRGLVSDITGTDVARLWERGGGPMAQPLGIDRAFLKEALQELTAQNPRAKVLNWMRHPVDSLRSLFSIPESAPRLAEFEAALKAEGWRPGQKVTFEQYVKAQLAAANVTVDFREGGTLAMWINQITPFFNANIQGPARMAAAIRNHPAATITAGVMWITLPALAMWWKQKDEEWYKQLTPMERYRYWHVKIPGTETALRIPKPFEWGHLFGSMPEGAMETAYGENPKAFSESVGVTLNSLAPNPLPGALEAPIEIAANRDFFRGVPLVPERMKRLKPEDQFAPYTSETAKKIGALLGVSPIYVEHLAEGWTGGLATDAAKAIESGVGVATHKTSRQIVGGLSAIPVAGRLFLSPIHTRVLDDFYNKLEKEEREFGSAKQHGEGAYNRKGQYVPSASLHNLRAASKALSELRRRSRSILDDTSTTDDEKRTAFMEIHARMIDVAGRATKGDFAPPKRKSRK